MGKKYAIIESGRQGPTAVYDLARMSYADLILLADTDKNHAEAAKRGNNVELELSPVN